MMWYNRVAKVVAWCRRESGITIYGTDWQSFGFGGPLTGNEVSTSKPWMVPHLKGERTTTQTVNNRHVDLIRM